MDGDRNTLKSIAQTLLELSKNPRKLYFRQFLLGLSSGLGATFGVAIVIAGLSLILRQLQNLPLISNFLEWLKGLSSF